MGSLHGTCFTSKCTDSLKLYCRAKINLYQSVRLSRVHLGISPNGKTSINQLILGRNGFPSKLQWKWNIVKWTPSVKTILVHFIELFVLFHVKFREIPSYLCQPIIFGVVKTFHTTIKHHMVI